MKYCPKCENEGWEPDENFTKPLVHKGKENFKKFSIRYWGCMNCGARFKTIEELYEYTGESDLFDDDNSSE